MALNTPSFLSQYTSLSSLGFEYNVLQSASTAAASTSPTFRAWKLSLIRLAINFTATDYRLGRPLNIFDWDDVNLNFKIFLIKQHIFYLIISFKKKW